MFDERDGFVLSLSEPAINTVKSARKFTLKLMSKFIEHHLTDNKCSLPEYI